jgi:uncharacterized membrane protein (DUF4010 family)
VPPELVVPSHIALAGLAGLAVGIEREWSGHASGPRARFAGVRTFFILGLLGGLAGWLLTEGRVAMAAVLVAAGGVLAVAAYVVVSHRTGDADGTTEAAALLVLAVGTLCGLGHGVLGSAVAAVTVLALAEKTRIHRFVARIGEPELRAALHFAVLALVVLPLLPAGPFGPYGAVRPRALWAVVLAFSGLNFLGYIARRAMGPARGYGLAGLLGGLVSSTAVTLAFSRQSRADDAQARSLGLGIVAACTMLLPRVLVVTLLMAPAVAASLALLLAPPLAVGLGLVAWGFFRARPDAGPADDADRNPLRLATAVQMAVAFQLVLLAIPAAEQLWGRPGVLGSAAVLGLTDMDALTYSMARFGRDTGAVGLAARAIAIGVLSNTLLKLGLTLALGSPRLRRAGSAALLALAAASAAGLWWVGR